MPGALEPADRGSGGPAGDASHGARRMGEHGEALTALERAWRLERNARTARESALSWGRLLSFFALLTAWYPFRHSDLQAAAAASMCALLFAVLVRQHRRAREARRSLDRKLALADESRLRLGGQLAVVRGHAAPRDADRDAAIIHLLEDGPRWKLTGQEIDDLDLYAERGGLFGLLNRSSTAYGASRLADALEHPLLDADVLLRRQQAVRQLDAEVEARMHAMSGAAALRGQDQRLVRMRQAVAQATPLPWGWEIHAMRAWSLVSIALTLVLTYRMGMGDYASGAWMLALLAANTLMFRACAKPLHTATAPWRDISDAARGYLSAAVHACEALHEEAGQPTSASDEPASDAQEPSRPGQKSIPHTEHHPSRFAPVRSRLGHTPAPLRSRLRSPAIPEDLAELRGAFRNVVAPDALPRLCRSVGWTDVGGPMHTLFNHLFFYDLHVASAILRTAVPHKDALLNGMAALADLEALCSLACFGWEQPTACYARFTAEPRVRIESGRHPCVDPRRCVANSLQLEAEPRVWLITGSNMSGKSTFLRMIGVNALLSQMGAPACAEELTTCPLRLMTDLRVRDNLAQNESYFLAEVRHLRRMVLPPPGEAPVLGLIDEPFRGTNSDEQGAATLAVVEHLKQSHHLFVIATHERKVTELADGACAVNRHFQENLDPSGMVFDYVLRDGPARTRNALRLLAEEKYPQAVLASAENWVTRISESGVNGRASTSGASYE
ncbi:MAG: hypothetical protein IT449_15785 [Phycisphaerales bacterium]|nr:hypothetical protein [Phycisphaerales bacterium]